MKHESMHHRRKRSLLTWLIPSLAAVIVLGVAVSSATAGCGVLRIGMTASDIPRTEGQPDNGFEGFRFIGYTLYDSLINWDLSRADKAAQLTPGLAVSWDVDPKDRTKWIFKLRRGVKFHDGSELDADAVVWNFEKVSNPKAPQYDPNQAAQIMPRLPDYKSSRKIDKYTVEITTKKPTALWPYEVSLFLIGSPAHWENLGRDWKKFARNPSGTGPFKLVKIVPRQRAELVPNAAYWDKKRTPKLDKLVLIPLPEPTSRLAALRAGQVDWIEVPPPDSIPGLKAAGFQIVKNLYPHIWPHSLVYTEGSPWLDERVRQAANLAIDREGICQSLLNDTCAPAEGMVSSGHPWFGTPTFKVRYDPAEARRLLKEAGFSKDNPVKAKVLISTGGSGQMLPLPMNEYIQQNLRDVGIDLEIEAIEWEALLQRWRAGAKHSDNKGVHALNISFTTQDPFNAFARHFHSRNVPPVSLNAYYHSDPKVDALLDKMEDTFDLTEQNKVLAELHTHLVDKAKWLFVVHDLNPRAMSKKVKGFVQAQSWFQDLTPICVK